MERGVKWTNDECVHLGQAQNNVIQDSIFGMEQILDWFWKKVSDLYFLLRTDDAMFVMTVVSIHNPCP